MLFSLEEPCQVFSLFVKQRGVYQNAITIFLEFLNNVYKCSWQANYEN